MPVERRRRARAAVAVALAALALLLANAGKPLVVDDTAYTYYARQIAAAPGDPYGFEILWYGKPEPAFGVLAPPVLPYWLAGSMLLFGDEPLRWKLALFPFALALAASLQRLLARFAPGLETPLLWMAVLSPPVLPFFNLMLDVPSLALALSALALFLAACDRDSLAGAVASGLVAGLAIQTKYTAATALAAMLVYGALLARLRLALFAAAVAACLFFGWEASMALRYGQPHFAQGLRGFLSAGSTRLESAALWTLGFLLLSGALAAPAGLLGLAALGLRRRAVGLAAAIVALCFAWIPFLPAVTIAKVAPWPHLVGAAPEQPLFLLLGLGTVASVAVVAWRLWNRGGREDRFLVVWLLVEIASFAALSPFLAARRVLGVSVVALLVCARATSRGLGPGRALAAVRVPAIAGIALGLLFTASEYADALAVRESVGLVEREMRALGADPERETVWFAGHWGFQFYAERAGMRPVAPGTSRIRRGDWIIVPEGIPSQRFVAEGRPFLVSRVDAQSDLPWSTYPWAYGSAIPMRRRAGATLRLWIYRVNADFVAAPAPEEAG